MDHGACSSFEKLYKFDGFNYIGWVEKMKFLLTSLNVYYVLDPNLIPISQDPPGEEADDEKVIFDLEKQLVHRKEDEALCYRYIRSSLSDRLCDLYSPESNNDPRLLWKALEEDFKATDHMKHRRFIGQFLDFRMVDGNPMMEQARELGIIVHKLQGNSIIIPEAVHVVALITKLPPSWKTFTERMMSKKDDNLSLTVLLKQIRAEERARKRKPKNIVSARPRRPVKNTKSTPGGHGPKTKLGIKKPNNFKKSVPRYNRSDAINDAQIDDLVALINRKM